MCVISTSTKPLAFEGYFVHLKGLLDMDQKYKSAQFTVLYSDWAYAANEEEIMKTGCMTVSGCPLAYG